MIPLWQRNGLIECPNCGWKQENTNRECSMCGHAIPSSISKKSIIIQNEYYNQNSIDNNQNLLKFNIEKLNIIIPSKFISYSDRKKLKFSNDFFKLISNLDEVEYDDQVLMNHFDNIVDKANSNFIQNEKNIKSTEFREYLDNYDGVLTDEDKEKLKEEYRESYYNYYFYLNFDYLIKKHNEMIINNEKNIKSAEFREYLDNYDGVLTEEDKKKLKEKYTENYFDYYSNLNFDYSIDKHNEKIINYEKKLILNDFNRKLSVKNIITDDDKENLKKKYNKDYFNFYDSLDLDSKIDMYNETLVKEEKKLHFKEYFSQSENHEMSVDEIISKIDCNLFNGESFISNDLNEEFDEFVKSPIFDLISNELNDEESSKLIIKIKEDISCDKISGDVADIIDFYFEQYDLIKKQSSLNNFLNEFIKSADFNKLSTMYSYEEDVIYDIVEHVRADIFNDGSMDEDKVILKLEYYFKAESNKEDYFNKLDRINDNSEYYMQKYNLTLIEFEEILKYIQIKITSGYHIKNIKNCFTNKIKEKIDLNRNESRLKLKRVLNNHEFIEKNNISYNELNQFSEHVGYLIYRNEIRSNEINEDFLVMWVKRN